MGNCMFCKNNSVHDGYCDHCGRRLGSFPMMIPFTFSKPTLEVTDKYLIFSKGKNVILSLVILLFGSILSFLLCGLIGEILFHKPGSGMFAGSWVAVILVAVLFSVFNPFAKTSDKDLLKQKSFGIIDIANIEKVTVYMPKRKTLNGAVCFQFRNGCDLLLNIVEQSGKTNANRLISTFQSIGIQTEVIEVASVANIKAKKPIATHKTLHLTVSQSAAQFIKPFAGQITLEF